jgi:maleate isomerase
MFGWRGRIGLLVPSTNFTVEVEFNRALPEGVSVHSARCLLKDATHEHEKVAAVVQMEKDVLRAAREVACVQPKVIVWACTSGSFLKGPGYDQEIIKDIQNETGIPALTTSTAVVDALKALGVKRLAVATPYIQQIDEKEQQFLEASVPGLTVTAMKGLGILSAFEKGTLAPASAYTAARSLDLAEAEAIFISCTAWRTFEIIELLERDTGKPVITSNQATLWSALRVLGVRNVRGYGQLLS